MAVKLDRPIDDLRIAVKAAPPEAMAQHDYRMRPERLVFFRQESPAQRHPGAEYRKVIARNDLTENIFIATGQFDPRGRRLAQRHRELVIGHESVQNRVPVAVVQIIAIRKIEL